MTQQDRCEGSIHACTKEKNIEVSKRNAQISLEFKESPDSNLRPLRSADYASQGLSGLRLL